MIGQFLLQIVFTFDRILLFTILFTTTVSLLLLFFRTFYHRHRNQIAENKKLSNKILKLKKLLHSRQKLLDSARERLHLTEKRTYRRDFNYGSPTPPILDFSFDELSLRIEKIAYSDSYSKYTPNSLPKFNFGSNENSSTLRIKNYTENNFLSWSMLIQSQFSRDNFWRSIPGYKFTTYGFFKVNTSEVNSGEDAYCFGAIVHAGIEGKENFPSNYSSFGYQEMAVDIIAIENYKFPVFISFINEKKHCASPNPANGQATCIAETQLDDAGYKVGILTARHVTGFNIGEEIDLRCGQKGIVVDVSPGSIDAAIVECDDCNTSPNIMMHPIENVAPWSDVSFYTAHSGVITAKVTSCENPLGIFDSSLFPLMILMDKHGDHGDSGSLVLDKDSGRPIGLYVGGYTDRAGRRGGIAQHLFQVTQIMKLNLYQQ